MGGLKSQDYLNAQILSGYLPNKDLMLKKEWVRSLQRVKCTVKRICISKCSSESFAFAEQSEIV